MMEENLLHIRRNSFNPLSAKLNPICHLLALLGAHHILHVSRVRVNTCFQFFLSFVAILRGRISAIGHEVQMQYTINVTENSEDKYAIEWCDLQNSLVLANICDSWAHSCHFQ